MDNDKIITFEIPKSYRFKERLYSKFVFEKINDRPADIKEALAILDLTMFMEDNYRKEQLNALQQLLIFRDAWWKMADDWKPDWNHNTEKYVIYPYQYLYSIDKENYRNTVLAFPTKEMRDAFFENFKDLIEQCKELL